MEVLIRKIKPQYLEKVIYVDDLKLVNKSLEGLKGKLEACKKLLDSKKAESECQEQENDGQ